MTSKPLSANGSESDFEFIETPPAPTPTFEKFEECGVRTTSVSQAPIPFFELPTWLCRFTASILTSFATVSIYQECSPSCGRWRIGRLFQCCPFLSSRLCPTISFLESRWRLEDGHFLRHLYHHSNPRLFLVSLLQTHTPQERESKIPWSSC